MPTIRTGDIETHYEDRGHGRAVVLVHAAVLDHASWRPQIADLGKDHRVVAYDLRGHGRTGGSDHRAYTVDMLAEDLSRLLRGLSLERPVVCGLSLGGMVALTFASRHPDALSGLILAGTPTPPLLSFSERFQRAMMPRAMIPVARLVGYERLKKTLVRTQERVHGKDALGTFNADDLPPMPTGEFAKAVRCFASFHRTSVDLAAIRVPTLVLYGENEPSFIPRHAHRLREGVPGATLAVIPGAGHASNLDQPAAFNDAVRTFVGAIQRPT